MVSHRINVFQRQDLNLKFHLLDSLYNGTQLFLCLVNWWEKGNIANIFRSARCYCKNDSLSPNALILIVGRCFTSRVHHQATPSVLANASYIMSFSISLFHFNLGSKQGIITADWIELIISLNDIFSAVVQVCQWIVDE